MTPYESAEAIPHGRERSDECGEVVVVVRFMGILRDGTRSQDVASKVTEK